MKGPRSQARVKELPEAMKVKEKEGKEKRRENQGRS
jgi:hypothetical protein